MRNDGANSPLATKGNLNEKRLASSMLIGKGLIPLEIIPRVKSRPIQASHWLKRVCQYYLFRGNTGLPRTTKVSLYSNII
jgi:hypothetical protein